MASLNYDDVYSFFLGYVADYDFLELSDEGMAQLFAEYLRKALAKPYLRRLFSSISFDEEEKMISYNLQLETDESADTDFVIDILAKSMVVEWLQPMVKSKLNIMQLFTGKEQKWYSQKDHLAELRALLEDAQLDVRRMIRDRGFISNSYLGGE